MELNILCLDDDAISAREAFAGLRDLMPDSDPVPIPFEPGTRRLQFTLRGTGSEPLKISFTVSEGTDPLFALDQVSEHSMFDLVLVDDHWGAHSETAGQEMFPQVLEKVRGPHEVLPIAALFTAHWDVRRAKSFCAVMERCTKQKSRVITGISKSDYSGLLILLQSVAIVKRIAQDRDALIAKLRHSEQVAHYDSPILNALRTKLYGIDDLLSELAKLLRPFHDWKDGTYDIAPVGYRRDFVTAILFEGEPGAGKSTICAGIAEALGSPEARLPKDLGPREKPRGWRRELDQHLAAYFRLATRGTVVVIRADDLTWPTPNAISDGGLRSDWHQYLNTLRDFIDDAGKINRGEQPTGPVRKLGISPQGKILWLFAKNDDADVGEMFGPLKDKLTPYKLMFPRDPETRRGIIEWRASRDDCTFDRDALDLAVEETLCYCGRDLIGDDTGERGFVSSVVSFVKDRELELINRAAPEAYTPERNITVAEVREWLKSFQHAGILEKHRASTGSSSQDQRVVPLTEPKIDSSDNVNKNCPDHGLRNRARQRLDEWEESCTGLVADGMDPKKINPTMLAKKRRERRQNIYQHLRTYGACMKALLDAEPTKWPTLRETQIVTERKNS